MLDANMIQTTGFRNHDDGSGFSVRIRSPYYRGIWTNLLDGAVVTVDGERFEASEVEWNLGGKRSSLSELQEAADRRWPVEEAAELTVKRAAPLGVGPHEVAVELSVITSYIPEELQPMSWSETRTLVITR